MANAGRLFSTIKNHLPQIGSTLKKIGSIITDPQKHEELRTIHASLSNAYSEIHKAGLLVECGKKWKIVRKILPNSAGNSAEKSEIVRENAK